VTADPYLDQPLPDGSGSRTLVTGASTDPGWGAVASDTSGAATDLAGIAGPGVLDWSQSFTVPGGAPTVTVTFDDTSRTRWLWLQLIVLLALVVLALPERRREDPDPDLDLDLATPVGERPNLVASEPATADGGEA
jgi:hypothetical protein